MFEQDMDLRNEMLHDDPFRFVHKLYELSVYHNFLEVIQSLPDELNGHSR